MEEYTQKNYEKVILEKIRIGLCSRISKVEIENMSFDVFTDVVANEMICRMEFIFLGKKAISEDIVKVPVSWVDALFEFISHSIPFFRKWVKYREICKRIEYIKVCPHINSSNYIGDHIEVLTMNDRSL